MTLEVVPTRYGAPAVEALAARVAIAKRGSPLDPVTVVVPSNYAGVAARRALARRDGVIGVTFVTIYRLAELLAGPTLAESGRLPVSSPVVASAVRAALALEPGVFGAVAGQPATVEALRRVHRELRDLSDAQRAVLATNPTAAAVLHVDREVDHRLAEGWFDETDLLTAAAALVRTDQATPLALGSVVVHLPQRIGPHAARLLLALSEARPVTVLLGLTGDEEADRAPARWLAHLDLAPPSAPESTGSAVVEQIVAADPDDEVRTAIRRVLRAAEDGTPIERIVVTFAPGAPYGRLLSDHLTAAGLPWNGVAPVPLTERVAGRAVLKAIELDPATLGRHDLFALLQSLPPVRGRPVPGWERLSRRAGVVAGVAEWDQRLERLGRELVDRTGEAGRRPADETPEQAERRAEARARLAEEVEGLRRFVATIVEHLEPPRGASWTAYVRWARRLRDDLLGPATHRSSWPAEELAAADRVDRALDRLARLDAVEGARVDLPTFRSVLEAELADGVTTSGRLGEGLFVGPLPLAIGIDADLVIALGLVEGGLPGSFGDDPLLSDQIRAATGTLTTSQERRDLLRHQLLAVGASGAGVVVASRCRTDLRNGAGRYRSRWWEAVAALGAAGTRHEHGSFHEGLLDQLPPGTEQEALLDDLWRHAASGRPLSAHPLVAADPVLDGALRMVDARAGSAFTEFDGNLRTVAAEGVSFLRDGAMSATALERWANCPFRYFLEVVLDVRDVDNPEDELSIRPIDRGNLVHRVLEQAVGDAIHRHDVPDPGSFWSPDTLEALDRAFGQESADAVARGLVGRPLYWRQARRRLERLLRIFLELDSRERADYGVRPVGAEMAFGREPPFHLELPNGRVLRIAGTIDRVDTSPERVVVIDYKTGSRQSTQREEAAGVRLQLPIYGLAARELLGLPTAAITGEYWHLHHEAKKRGRTTVEVDAERQQQLYTTLATITDGIATGVFVAHPAPPDPWRPWVPCAPCDPDGSGTATVWGQWQRKRRAPELAAYFALVEPEPPDDDGGDRPGGPDLQIADLDWSPA